MHTLLQVPHEGALDGDVGFVRLPDRGDTSAFLDVLKDFAHHRRDVGDEFWFE